MKFSHFILSVLLSSAIAAGFAVNYTGTKHGGDLNKKESSYERVLNTKTLRCGYVNWQPYFIKDPNTGNLSGINYEIMTEVGKILDLKIEWAEEIGWGTIGEGFKTGRYDAVCTSMWADAGKIKNMSLSIPIFYTNIVAYARTNDNRFDGKFDRINNSDVRIAAIDGAFSYNLAKEQFPNSKILALPQLVQESEFLMTVPSYKADIILSDIDEIKKFIKANPNKMRLVKDIKPIKKIPQVIAMPTNEAQLTQMINQALQLLIDNGYMEKIKKKYETEYTLPSPNFVQ
jgi:ABC-type amino acid transport substrate-binding protein